MSVGPNGLLARSIIGWQRLRVALADIAAAGVVEVDPMAEFGGWGVRWVIGPRGKGRWGILTRRGPALEIVRRDGRSLVFTVDDSATAASVLEKYAKGANDDPCRRLSFNAASRREPESAEFSVWIIGDPRRRLAWLLGVLAMLTGFVLHAVPISVSRLALVQPILVAERLLTGVPFSDAWIYERSSSRTSAYGDAPASFIQW